MFHMANADMRSDTLTGNVFCSGSHTKVWTIQSNNELVEKLKSWFPDRPKRHCLLYFYIFSNANRNDISGPVGNLVREQQWKQSEKYLQYQNKNLQVIGAIFQLMCFVQSSPLILTHPWLQYFCSKLEMRAPRLRNPIPIAGKQYLWNGWAVIGNIDTLGTLLDQSHPWTRTNSWIIFFIITFASMYIYLLNATIGDISHLLRNNTEQSRMHRHKNSSWCVVTQVCSSHCTLSWSLTLNLLMDYMPNQSNPTSPLILMLWIVSYNRRWGISDVCRIHMGSESTSVEATSHAELSRTRRCE